MSELDYDAMEKNELMTMHLDELEEEIETLKNRPACGYCKDCKHWVHSNCFGSQEVTLCGLIDVDRNDIAWVWTDDQAALFTGPDFGCIQFEAKE
jgi:hypothetical protein